MSLEQPPKPFVNFDGGDEWTYCLRGADIKPLIEKFKGKTDVELSMYSLDKEDEEWEEIVFTIAQWQPKKIQNVSGVQTLRVITHGKSLVISANSANRRGSAAFALA